MALSFEESKKQALKQATAPMLMSLANEVVVDSPEVFTRDNSGKYKWYEEYSDDKISTVDNLKNITVDSSQINLTQEENSQYVPFQMDRYYDGIDLMGMTIQIHYVNASKYEEYCNPINVQYSNTKILFGWLVPSGATAAAGDLTFEITAHGINENGDNYMWRTRPNGKLNVIKSLAGNGVVQPSTDWYVQFVSEMDRKVNEAKNSADRAEEAANKIEGNIEDQVNKQLETSINNKLTNYYTKNEVDTKLSNVKVDLTGYATEKYVDEKVAAVDVSEQLKDYAKREDIKPIPTEVSAFNNDAGYLTNENLENYALKSEVPSIEGLASEDYVNQKIAEVDVSDQLADYAKKSDLTNISSKVNTIEQTVNSDKESITAIGTKVASLEDAVGKINTDPGKTYDATYGTVGEEDNIYTLWEIENEGEDNEVRTAKSQFKISGGGGGGGTTSTLKIEYVTKSPLIVTTNDKAIIKYNFSGQDSSGDEVGTGDFTWKIGRQIIATGTAVSGENTFDATDYISLGTQKLLLTITDSAGSLVTKTWTVQKVNIRLESSFNDKLTYNIGPVFFDYTPYGAISKDIHFKLDGVELTKVTTSSSGIPMAYSIPAQTHGAHLLEVYITAEINSSTIESNHIFKDIIWYNPESEDAVIGCVSENLTVKQYDTENIVYTVYDPKTETPTVTLAVDGNVVSTLQLDSNTQTWQYKPTDIGSHVLTITCRGTVKTINVTVEKLDINVEPITAGLQFDFNPVGRSNNDANRLWSHSENADIKMTVSNNFDWENGGYQIDENGDQYFGIKAGTTATISYNLFADDARKNGKEFKLIFKTDNVAKSDATFLTCQSGDTTQIGLQMNVHEAYIKSSAKSLYVPYSEGDIIEWEFNIAKDTDIPIVMSYEDGTPCRPMSYTSDYSFTQESPVPITIGSTDCDVMIYRMKAYNTSLSSSAILSNFIADARTATEMIDRYKRNQIYDENNLLTPESVAEACPNMRVIKIEAPYFTNNKKDFVKNTSVECIYKNGDVTLDNWKFTNMYHSGQGTTSNEYGASGRNIDIIGGFDGVHQVTSKVTLDPSYITELTLGDGTKVSDGTGKVSLTRSSVPNNWFNIKVRYLPLYAVMYIV